VASTVPIGEWRYVYADALSTDHAVVDLPEYDGDQSAPTSRRTSVDADADADADDDDGIYSDPHRDDYHGYGGEEYDGRGVEESKTGPREDTRAPARSHTSGRGSAPPAHAPLPTPTPDPDAKLDDDSAHGTVRMASDPRRWLAVAVGLYKSPDESTVLREFGAVVLQDLQEIGAILMGSGVQPRSAGLTHATDLYRAGPARVRALTALFSTRPYLVVEIVNQFASAWKEALAPLVKACCEDIAGGRLSTGLLEATRERFKSLLRGHTSLFVLSLGTARGARVGDLRIVFVAPA
jgi:hypothetical protein